MSNLKIQELEKSLATKEIPVLRPGYQVRVHQKIKEGEKERVQIFEGVVLSLNGGHGLSQTVTVRKVVEGIGVEKVFPLYSPNVVKIEVKKTFGVSKAKVYFLREAENVTTRLKTKLNLIEKDKRMVAKKGGNKVVANVVEEVVEEKAPATDEQTAA